MDNRLKNLKDVMAVQTTSYNVKMMNKYIRKFVADIPGCTLYKNHGNLYVTRGEADLYPCVVAHTDTVHDIHKEFHVKRHKDALYAIDQDYSRVGIGGDDKVGVFVALEILRTTEICKVAFFRDEEVGCVGSKVADMSFFTDVAFVLQCDRQGYADFVNNIFYSDLYCDEFSKAIKPLLDTYGRTESDGGMTDVWQLTENGLEVAVANMSCGYYDPHSDNEYILISEVFATLDFVEDLVASLSYKRWTIKTEARDGYGSYGGYYGGWTKKKSKKTKYRRYGGVAETSWEAEDWGDEVEKPRDSWKEDYVIPNVKCTQCESTGEVCYDSTVQMHWCFSCQDYVREEMLEGLNEGVPSLEIDDEGEFVYGDETLTTRKMTMTEAEEEYHSQSLDDKLATLANAYKGNTLDTNLDDDGVPF